MASWQTDCVVICCIAGNNEKEMHWHLGM